MTIDRRSYLPVAVQLVDDEHREIVRFQDWQQTAGGVFPFVVSTADADYGDVDTITVRSITRLATVPARRFAMPAQPRDVRLPRGVRAVDVPYVVDGNKPIVQVSLNGSAPLPFVLDTGGHFIVTAQTARRLHLHGFGAATSVNQNQAHTVQFARIATLRVGGAVLTGQVAEINAYGFAKIERGRRTPKAGWLGLEFLEHFAVTFDSSRRILTLRPLQVPRPRISSPRLPLYFTEDAPLVACRIAGAPGTCMLDTGNAGATIVNWRWAAAHGLAAMLAAGREYADRVRLSRAQVVVGSVRRGNEIVAYSPPRTAAAETFSSTAAILSERVIDSFVMTLDYGDDSVYLVPRSWSPPPASRTGIVADKLPTGLFRVYFLMPHSSAGGRLRVGDVIEAVDVKPARDLSGADFARVSAEAVSRHTYVVRRGAARMLVTVPTRTLLPLGR